MSDERKPEPPSPRWVRVSYVVASVAFFVLLAFSLAQITGNHGPVILVPMYIFGCIAIIGYLPCLIHAWQNRRFLESFTTLMFVVLVVMNLWPSPNSSAPWARMQQDCQPDNLGLICQSVQRNTDQYAGPWVGEWPSTFTNKWDSQLFMSPWRFDNAWLNGHWPEYVRGLTQVTSEDGMYLRVGDVVFIDNGLPASVSEPRLVVAIARNVHDRYDRMSWYERYVRGEQAFRPVAFSDGTSRTINADEFDTFLAEENKRRRAMGLPPIDLHQVDTLGPPDPAVP